MGVYKSNGGIIGKVFPAHGNGTPDGRTGLKFHDVPPGADPFCGMCGTDPLRVSKMNNDNDDSKEGAES